MSNTRAPVLIESWSVVAGTRDPYTAPEVAGIKVTGYSIDHPAKPGRHPITTSRVAAVRGTVVETASGSLYALGAPDRVYLEYLASIGRTFDPAEPIKMVTR